MRLRAGVRRLFVSGGLFRAESESGETLAARVAVIATGAFQEPSVPPFARGLSADLVQLTAATHLNSRQLPGGRVLVVGDGATGRQIALEITGTRDVWLAMGRRRVVVPQRILARDQMRWSQMLGMLRASRESAVGRLLRKYEPFPGEHLRLRNLKRPGVRIAARVHGAQGRTVPFADGTAVEVDAVVWTTGYRERTDWVDIPGAKDAQGRFVERRGISPVRHLYFVGREWQWTRGSGLLAGVARDAMFVAERILEQLSSTVPTRVVAGTGLSLVAAGSRSSR